MASSMLAASEVAAIGCSVRDLHDGELVAAEPCDGVASPTQRAQAFADGLQQRVAGRDARACR